MGMEEQLKDVISTASKYYEKLQQMQNLQSYFQEHRDLITWIKRLQHAITRYFLFFVTDIDQVVFCFTCFDPLAWSVKCCSFEKLIVIKFLDEL